MNKKQLLKKINKTNWYRQGGAVLPYYTSPPLRIALDYYDGFNYYKGKNNYSYFGKDKERKFCDKIISKQIKDKNYISKNLIQPWFKLKKKQDIFDKKITKKYLERLPDKELIDLHLKFIEIRFKIWSIGVLIESFDPWDITIINEFLSEYGININLKDIALLIGPQKLTFIQKELLERLQIAEKMKKNEKMKKLLSKHTKKYSSFHNSWAEIRNLDENYFIDLIKKDAEKKNILKEIDNIKKIEADIKRKRKKILKKYNLPKQIENLFYFFSEMTDWRDERKSQAMKVNMIADLFLHEISRRTGINHKYLCYLDAWEIKSLKHIKNLKQELIDRTRGSISHNIGKRGIKWYVGKEAEKIHESLESSLTKSNVIKGTIANKGIAKARVKIIITLSDFHKMEKGNIIVTQMTRPEYTPILHKATAIITDEGGITCHAAVVSRELNIPCIIGTQIATSVLKDGDYIEVDANKGVVRKIKEKKIK